jgi:hypothetical protein
MRSTFLLGSFGDRPATVLAGLRNPGQHSLEHPPAHPCVLFQRRIHILILTSGSGFISK